MKAQEKHLIKEKLRMTKWATIKQTGKKPTKEEMINVILEIVKSVKPQENWKPKGEINSIGEILGRNK